MCVRVYYVSPRGSAEEIAGVIAEEARCVKEPLLPAYMPENLQIMFLGCEREYDKVTCDFINSLNPDRTKTAAIFFCGRDTAVLNRMRRALNSRGIAVFDMTFTAPCKGIFGTGGPGEADKNRARLFARDCLKTAAENDQSALTRELLAARGIVNKP